MMKPTLRRNGKHMVNLEIRWVIDGLRVVQIVAAEEWNSATDFGNDPFGRIGKGQVEKAVRSHLSNYGDSEWDTWAERFSDENDAEMAYRWAREQVERWFPELVNGVPEEFD